MDFNERYSQLSSSEKYAIMTLTAQSNMSVYMGMVYLLSEKKIKTLNNKGIPLWFKQNPKTLVAQEVQKNQEIFSELLAKYDTKRMLVFDKKHDFLPWLSDSIQEGLISEIKYVIVDYENSTFRFTKYSNMQIYFILKKVAVDYREATGVDFKFDLNSTGRRYLDFVCAGIGEDVKVTVPFNSEHEVLFGRDRKVIAKSYQRNNNTYPYWERVIVYDKGYFDVISGFAEEFSSIINGFKVEILFEAAEDWYLPTEEGRKIEMEDFWSGI
jgi:hypothetical protein